MPTAARSDQNSRGKTSLLSLVLVSYWWLFHSDGKWPLPLMTYAECSSLRLSLALASFLFPAWFTFENINLCPRKFLARKINPPTYKGAIPTPPPPPSTVFLSLFFLEDKTLAPDVFSNCLFIPRAHF